MVILLSVLVLLTLILTVTLAALGRRAVPRAERIPLRARRGPDLLADVARGGRVLWTFHEDQCRLWDAYLDELQPWQPRYPATRGDGGQRGHRPSSSRAGDTVIGNGRCRVTASSPVASATDR